ncbi:hypothetical protein AA11826_2069 [Komagataeibacter oboediens DSM 11826]|nr:hypothetical protein AA11826_2069 [Komagataeibacter oboediens DSM 11826]
MQKTVLRPASVAAKQSRIRLSSAEKISALKATGTLLLVTVTSLEKAHATETTGMDAIVAQGIEAGGHRGIFGPTNHDDALGTFALTRLLLRKCNIPVIAAGGIMDGAGMAAAFALGAVAAQMGTAFILCPKTDADEAYRKALADQPRFIHAWPFLFQDVLRAVFKIGLQA